MFLVLTLSRLYYVVSGVHSYFVNKFYRSVKASVMSELWNFPSTSLFLLFVLNSEVKDCSFREDVVVHAERGPFCVREEHKRGRDARQKVEGEVRLPAGVVHE